MAKTVRMYILGSNGQLERVLLPHETNHRGFPNTWRKFAHKAFSLRIGIADLKRITLFLICAHLWSAEAVAAVRKGCHTRMISWRYVGYKFPHFGLSLFVGKHSSYTH